MITFVLAFVGLVAIAVIFIALGAKKRSDGSVERTSPTQTDQAGKGRATGPN